jgi:DNA repair exonuclease SbcCD ATPase subunit
VRQARGSRLPCRWVRGRALAANIADLVERLQQQEAAVAVARNRLNEDTFRAQAAFRDTAQKLGLCIAGLTSAPRELDAEEAQLVELEQRRAVVLKKQADIEQAIADAPDWRMCPTGRDRDREYERQRTLKQQLQLLRAGTLLFAPNQCYPRLEDLDARLKESNERIESLRAQLAAHLQQAEVLLGETVTTSA